MKLLKDKANVGAVDAVWLYGNVIDDTGSDDGTRVNKEFITDYVQLFERIMAKAGIAANGLPDNETNGWQLYEAFRALTRNYNVYTITISQVVTNIPTINQLSNQIGGIVWSRASIGTYDGVLGGAFTDREKTWLYINPHPTPSTRAIIEWKSISKITITTTDLSGTLQDVVLNDTSVEIRNY